MAIICDEHRLLFIMAPHTGCTAVGETLRMHLPARFIPDQDITDPKGEILVPRKHSELAQLQKHGVLTPDARAQLLVASTIRNPFDALVSHFVKVQGRYEADPDRRPLSTKATRDFEDWLRYRFRPSLRARLRGREKETPVRWTVGSDVVMRFERLQEDFDELLRRVGVTQPIEIISKNVTQKRAHRPYQAFYTSGARQLVEEVFADDLAEFGYTFEPAAAA